MTFHSRCIRLALTLGFMCGTTTPSLAQQVSRSSNQQSSSQTSSSVLPAPPSTPPLPRRQPPGGSLTPLPTPPATPPLNRTRSGGSLGVESCTSSNTPLLALVPAENPVFTTAEHPTLLFYVPYHSADIRVGEFSVLVGIDETTQLYRTQFTLPDTPGIVSISLPRSPQYALQEGVFYHWYFKLYCKDNTTSRADSEVNGWIQRVAITPEREQQINNATPDIWYDALAQLSDRLRTSPQNSELQNRWHTLLKFIHLEDLTQAPLAGPVTVIENE